MPERVITFFQKKLKASTLSYVIGLSLLIMLLIMVPFVINRYAYKEINHLQHRLQLSDKIQSAINLFEQGVVEVEYDQLNELTVFQDETPVHYFAQKWGLLDLLTIYGQQNIFHDTVTLITGNYQPLADSLCLYLSDQMNYLSITGSTLLRGNCFLPKTGITKAYIEGQTYASDTLVFGSIKESEQQLPALKPEMGKRFSLALDSLREGKFERLPDSLFVPFNQSKVVYRYNSEQFITSSHLGGKVMVVCDSTITISPYSQLDGCIITAKRIIIEKGFKGRLQAFATERIEVKDSCSLLYPSTLWVKNQNEASLRIGTGCYIGGICLVTGQHREKNLVEVATNTIIEGQVYSQAVTELKGSVWGELYAERFVYKTPYGIYDDLLLNVVIDKQQLSQHFIGINLFEDKKPRLAAVCY